jgi:hypothetical protein
MIDDPTTPVDEAHLFEPHHDRHVWLYRENPSGVFAPFNTAVTCEHHQNHDGHLQPGLGRVRRPNDRQSSPLYAAATASAQGWMTSAVP